MQFVCVIQWRASFNMVSSSQDFPARGAVGLYVLPGDLDAVLQQGRHLLARCLGCISCHFGGHQLTGGFWRDAEGGVLGADRVSEGEVGGKRCFASSLELGSAFHRLCPYDLKVRHARRERWSQGRLYTPKPTTLRKKSAIAAKAKANQIAAGGDKFSEKPLPQNSAKAVTPIDTREEIAKAANVSHDTVHKVDTILKMAEPEIVQAVRDNRISINLASQLADLPKEEQRVVASKPPEEIKEVAREVLKQAHVSNNTGNNEWYTPAKYIEMAMAVMGSIDTDPATSVIANKTVKATKIFTAEDNGLAQKWSGNVWMNPPYAQPLISQFSEAIANKFVSGEISQGIVLVNNATETAWFQILLAQASAVCFPKSRVRFVAPDGSLGAPLQGQAIVYFGSNAALFGEVFGKEGTVLYHG